MIIVLRINICVGHKESKGTKCQKNGVDYRLRKILILFMGHSRIKLPIYSTYYDPINYRQHAAVLALQQITQHTWRSFDS